MLFSCPAPERLSIERPHSEQNVASSVLLVLHASQITHATPDFFSYVMIKRGVIYVGYEMSDRVHVHLR